MELFKGPEKKLDPHFARKQGKERHVACPGASQGDIMEFQIACLLFEKHKTILLYHMSDRQDYDMNRINCGDIMV